MKPEWKKVVLQRQKKWRINVISLQLNMRFPQTWNIWKFAMFENFINSQLLKPIVLSPEPLWNSDNQKISNFKINFFYCIVTSSFVVKLFLLLFSSRCSTQNIGFNDSGNVIKPPQPSSAIYGAPPVTGNPIMFVMTICPIRIEHFCTQKEEVRFSWTYSCLWWFHFALTKQLLCFL